MSGGSIVAFKVCYSEWMSDKSRTSLPARPSAAIPRFRPDAPAIALPAPALNGGMSLQQCLSTRRSSRNFSPDAVSLDQCSALLWAAQGVTGLGGLRTAPSAGAVYPLRLYLAAANVDGLSTGSYSYDPDLHQLRLLSRGDKRRKLYAAAMGQECVRECALCLLIATDCRRITREFGERGETLARMEAGHAGENFLLQATALGLGAIGLGNIDATILRAALPVPAIEAPVYLLLAGRV